MNSSVYDVTKLFEMGAHLGHKKSRLHPRARKYVHTMLNGVSIIDLTKTTDQLAQATKVLQRWAHEGKVVLFVGTKKTVSRSLGKKCEEIGIPYVSSKWHCGTITNFDSIAKNVNRLRTLKQQKKNGEWDQYVKHEQTKLEKEIVKLERLYGGLQQLQQLPDALCIVDIKTEKNALHEANQYHMPVVAVVDTNANPELVGWPVIVNDDSEQVMDVIVGALIDAYASGRSIDVPVKEDVSSQTVAEESLKKKKNVALVSEEVSQHADSAKKSAKPKRGAKKGE